jgi:hypothetical protein
MAKVLIGIITLHKKEVVRLTVAFGETVAHDITAYLRDHIEVTFPNILSCQLHVFSMLCYRHTPDYMYKLSTLQHVLINDKNKCFITVTDVLSVSH